MIPPNMMSPYYYDWYDPQNNPYWAYYYQGFDPNYFNTAIASGRSRSQTPQPTSYSQSSNATPAPQMGSTPFYLPYPPPPPPYFWPYPPPFMGFRPISQSRETTPCMSESERYMKTPTNEDRNRRAVSCTPTCCQHAKPFPVESNQNKFHTMEEPLIKLSSSTSSIERRNEATSSEDEEYSMRREKSLKSVPSMKNVKMFADENGDRSIGDSKITPLILESETETESEDDTTEVEEDISQDTTMNGVHYPHQLSVIYEENESYQGERRSSVISRSSTLSDCSTTLMEDDNLSIDDEVEDDETSNSVTVRLPLKFSFSRSKDNLVNTTVVVGKSESSENLKTSSSRSPERRKSISYSPERKPVENHSSQPPPADVSVTVRLKSKSKSRTPERIINTSLSIVNDIDVDSPDCSMSFSLLKKLQFEHLKVQDEKSTENSVENKKNIDTSLFTSFDALEEIKKGMAEITNSLCSKLCVLRKSALNIPESEMTRRSSSTSQIESIETDSENDIDLSYAEVRMDENDEEEEEESENDEEIAPIEENLIEFSKSCANENINEEDDTDFWSQITSANKNFDNDETNLSKTSTRSSRYWFEDEPEIDAQPEKVLDDAEKEETEIVEKEQDNEEEVDFWKDYDEECHLSSRKNNYEDPVKPNDDQHDDDTTTVETETEYEYETENDDVDETEPIKQPAVETTLRDAEQLASDEEWTEVEVTDDEESEKIEVIETPKKEVVDEISEYEEVTEDESEEELEEDDDESPEIVEKPTQDIIIETPEKIEEDSEYSSAEEEDDEDEKVDEILPSISANKSQTHSMNDCHLLTPTKDSHDEKVLLPTLTMDNDENEDSEEEYEDSTNQQQDDEKTVEIENEVVVNVKGKISMFERAMSEEPAIEKSSRESSKIVSRNSFRYRESSEPPITFTKAPSEVKEISKNQSLLERINQKKLATSNESEEKRKSVKDRVSSFESRGSVDSDASERRENFKLYGSCKSSVRSIDESGEEDSGVNSDFCKQLSENETDSEHFPELRKLSRYQRASTHSRLFKLLQDDDEVDPSETTKVEEVEEKQEKTPIAYKSKKIIHNVSATRRQNPKAALEAETMEERRQRLCLPLSHQSSSGAESMSSSTTPSPTPGGPVNEKLVNELVQSLLSQKRGRAFRNLPIEKLHAAAVRILQEDLDSNGTLSSADESTIPTVDSTPALTPQEFRNNSSYSEYYDSWENGDDTECNNDLSDFNLIQSKAFKALQEQQITASKKLWSVRCPRILSSKSVNKDLARVSEVRESESPEPSNHIRSSSIEALSGNEEININKSTERRMAKT